MRILLVHGYYQIPGGEDEYFETRRDFLRAHGHEVVEYVRRNEEISRYGIVDKIALAGRTVWAWDTNRELARVLRDKKPDIAHFGNTFPLISPSAYYECKRAGVPVVQQLDNPRLMCPSAMFFRDGKSCHDCVGRFPWPGIVHSCYRNSSAQTTVVASMLGAHRALGTWKTKVDAYMVATEFYRQKFLDFGLPVDRVHLSPLPVPDPGRKPRGHGDYALYIGRLAEEKGIGPLLEAWRGLDISLKVRGSGPMENDVRAAIATNPGIQLVPRLSLEQKYDLVRNARFLVWPSLGEYETFGLVVAEAYACSVPVIASRTGVAPEMVPGGQTGVLFAPNDAADLAKTAQWAWEHPEEMSAMGSAGRTLYESKFTPELAYHRLLATYESVAHPHVAGRSLSEAHASGS